MPDDHQSTIIDQLEAALQAYLRLRRPGTEAAAELTRLRDNAELVGRLDLADPAAMDLAREVAAQGERVPELERRAADLTETLNELTRLLPEVAALTDRLGLDPEPLLAFAANFDPARVPDLWPLLARIKLQAKQGEGGPPPADPSKRIPLAEAEIKVREWLAANAKDNPAAVTRDAVAAGAGVSGATVSRTAGQAASDPARELREFVPLAENPRPYQPGPPPSGANPYLTLRHVLHELFWQAACARQGQDVLDHINPTTGPWNEAEARARSCSAGWGIPFATFDPILTDAKRAMRDLAQVAAGNTSVVFAATDSRYAMLEERLQELANSVPAGDAMPATNTVPTSAGPPPAVPAPSPNGTQQGEVGPPPADRPKGIPLAEAEIKVRDWLAANAKDDPAAVTRDAVAAGAGVSAGQVSKTAAWRAFRERRDAAVNLVAREVPLTDAMRSIVPSSCPKPDELAALIEEQAADDAERKRRHRHRPS